MSERLDDTRVCSMKPFWYETCLRVKNMDESVSFFAKHFGMCVIAKREDGDTLYSTLISPRKNERIQVVEHEKPNTLPSLLKDRASLTLRCEKQYDDLSDIKLNNGNEEPHRGFGHIAFNCDCVYASCVRLEAQGVTFRKRPDEGRMKGLAFALDPNGYWIEICSRGKHHFDEEFNLSQTMIRIKDPKISIPFYTEALGMVVLREMHMNDFSNYFLGCLAELPDTLLNATPDEQRTFVHRMWNPCLELTHNHGTENDREFHYHDGNSPPPAGFSHIGFHVCSLSDVIKSVLKNGGSVDAQSSSNITWIRDPDGYRVKLLDKHCLEV